MDFIEEYQRYFDAKAEQDKKIFDVISKRLRRIPQILEVAEKVRAITIRDYGDVDTFHAINESIIHFDDEIKFRITIAEGKEEEAKRILTNYAPRTDYRISFFDQWENWMLGNTTFGMRIQKKYHKKSGLPWCGQELYKKHDPIEKIDFSKIFKSLEF